MRILRVVERSRCDYSSGNMQKWRLVFKVGVIVGVLLAVKSVAHLFDLDDIPVNVLFSTFVGGVVFTVAIIFSGTLADYKESERIPGELATSIKTLYNDTYLIGTAGATVAVAIRSHVKELLRTLNANFKRNDWDLKEINTAMDVVNRDVSLLAQTDTPPIFLARYRTELTNIDRIANRVETITKTSFLPAAYAIAELSIGLVLGVLIFTKTDPYYEGLLFLGVVSFLMISILLLIQDMDNPFEVGKKTYADVDMSILFDLESYLESNP